MAKPTETLKKLFMMPFNLQHYWNAQLTTPDDMDRLCQK